MSNVNISRLVENISPIKTNIYTPVIELIVNAIQAIEEIGRQDGKVSIRVIRSLQTELDKSLSPIVGFEVLDNGIGFTNEHLESFDTLYTDAKSSEGGKGFGRFSCLKYFKNFQVESVYRDGDDFKERIFSMGNARDIVVNEKSSNSDKKESGTTVRLTKPKDVNYEKQIDTLAKSITEKILPYFIADGYECPKIMLSEIDGQNPICLNEFVGDSEMIRKIEENEFSIDDINNQEDFSVQLFRIYSPGNQQNRISLVAHEREVSGSSISQFIPEFADPFFDEGFEGEWTHKYIIKAYVFGDYLDQHVSLERGGFEFPREGTNLFCGISEKDIEKEAANIAKATVGSEIVSRQERKKNRFQEYVDNEAPWHKRVMNGINIDDMPFNATPEEMEMRLRKEKLDEELEVKKNAENILSGSSPGEMEEKAGEIVSQISDISKDELAHYVALRRSILDFLEKSLQVDDSGRYCNEGVVHDIIFPRRGDTEETRFSDHNLWLLDERLNFTEYVSSDKRSSNKNSDRPDILAYGRRVLFRESNESSNPVTIFEFKKPQRDDFADPSSSENPVQQIIRYVNEIKRGEYRTPQGRDINIGKNTPSYGYIVCDATQKFRDWIEEEQDFKPMPDGQGWFIYRERINLYIEVISWDKLLQDAIMRNKIFFNKLGI